MADPEPDPAQARLDALRRMQDEILVVCGAEIDAVLQRHRCRLVGVPRLVADGASHRCVADIVLMLKSEAQAAGPSGSSKDASAPR